MSIQTVFGITSWHVSKCYPVDPELFPPLIYRLFQ